MCGSNGKGRPQLFTFAPVKPGRQPTGSLAGEAVPGSPSPCVDRITENPWRAFRNSGQARKFRCGLTTYSPSQRTTHDAQHGIRAMPYLSRCLSLIAVSLIAATTSRRPSQAPPSDHAAPRSAPRRASGREAAEATLSNGTNRPPPSVSQTDTTTEAGPCGPASCCRRSLVERERPSEAGGSVIRRRSTFAVHIRLARGCEPLPRAPEQYVDSIREVPLSQSN